jgi:hypothetical protein
VPRPPARTPARTPVLPALLLGVVLAGVALLGGGCSDDEKDEPAPDPARIRAGLAALFAGDHPTAEDRGDGACFARRLEQRTTPDTLRAAGVLDASYAVVADVPRLPDSMARLWVDAEFACVDIVERSTRAQQRVSHGDLDAAAYAACLRAALDDDALRAAVAGTLSGDWESPAVTRYSHALDHCAARSGG